MARDFEIIINEETSYYLAQAASYKNTLSGMAAASIGAIATFIALLQSSQINFNNIAEIIPFFVALNFIGYGLSLLYTWYDGHNVKTEIDQLKSGISQKEFVKDVEKETAPDLLIRNVIAATVTILALISIFMIVTADQSFELLLLILLFSILIIIVLVHILNQLKKACFSDGTISSKSDFGAKEMLNFIFNNKNFYFIVLLLFLIGATIILLYNVDNALNLIIISLYLIIAEILLVNSLKTYGHYSNYINKARKLHGIKEKMIRDEYNDSIYINDYNIIIEGHQFKNLKEKYLK